MRRGDIYLTDFEPARGSEVDSVRPMGVRPAAVVSRDALNRVVEAQGYGVVTVVPLTSNIARVLSFQVLLPAEATGLNEDSKAQAEQVRSVSNRVGGRLGNVPAPLMARLDAALRLHLAL